MTENYVALEWSAKDATIIDPQDYLLIKKDGQEIIETKDGKTLRVFILEEINKESIIL